MRVAAWLDVALEGGVLELERALEEYRTLRRLLGGDWRARAGKVAEVTGDARLRHREVEAALERARRRVRMDSAAAPAAALAARVEQEREALMGVLAKVRGAEAGFPLQLDWLFDAATDEAFFERSQVRFRSERLAWTVLFLGLTPSLPWHAWYTASDGGTVPVTFGIVGLGEAAVWGPLLALLAAVLASWARLLSWTWLGVQPPRFLNAAVVGGVIGLCAAAALVSVMVQTVSPLGATLMVAVAFGMSQVLWAFWRAKERLE